MGIIEDSFLISNIILSPLRMLYSATNASNSGPYSTVLSDFFLILNQYKCPSEVFTRIILPTASLKYSLTRQGTVYMITNAKN